jgi:hypothetical protein
MDVLDIMETFDEREVLVEAIADAEPFVKPGTVLAYHAVTSRPES